MLPGKRLGTKAPRIPRWWIGCNKMPCPAVCLCRGAAQGMTSEPFLAAVLPKSSVSIYPLRPFATPKR